MNMRKISLQLEQNKNCSSWSRFNRVIVKSKLPIFTADSAYMKYTVVRRKVVGYF